MTTANFAAYKAIIISDRYCDSYLDDIKFLVESNATWGRAVTGNITLIDTLALLSTPTVWSTDSNTRH